MAAPNGTMFYQLLFYAFGLFNWCLYLSIAIYKGSFFRKDSEQDRLQLAIARDSFWNLAKTVGGLSHRFFTLKDGRQLHYLTNTIDADASRSVKPLVILIHGFPDSCIMWRHLLDSTSSLGEKATLVAVDLPGYGGSDGCDKYSPEEVLEALTEFIVAMRDLHVERQYYGDPNGHADKQAHGGQQVYIVGHDWGCVLAFRLAAEAPALADRFILTNGPLVPLALDNKDNIMCSSRRIFNTFVQAPIARRSCLRKSLDTLKPLLIQLLLFGYIAAFHLPRFMVAYLGTGGNYAFLRGALRAAYGKDKSEWSLANSMAATLGPSEDECKTQISDGSVAFHNPDGTESVLSYSPAILHRAKNPGSSFLDKTGYYTDGAGTQKWQKSLETLASLYNIECEDSGSSDSRRRRSSSSGIFEPAHAGSLRAPATIIWGQKDQACTQRICLDGIGDYLAKRSQVVLLPRTGHWTAVEKESRIALGKVVEWYIDGGDVDGKGDVAKVVKQVYQDATLMVRK